MYFVKGSVQLRFKDKKSYQAFQEDAENEVIDKLNINNQLIDCDGLAIETVDRRNEDGELEPEKEKKGTTFTYIDTKRPTFLVGDVLIIEGLRFMIAYRKGIYFINPMDNDFELLSEIDFNSLEEMKDALINLKLNYSTQANV